MRISGWLIDSLKFMSRDTIKKVVDVLIIGDDEKSKQPRDDHEHFYHLEGAPCPHDQGESNSENSSSENSSSVKAEEAKGKNGETKSGGKYHRKFSEIAKQYIQNGELSDESIDKVLAECDNIDPEEVWNDMISGGRHSGMLKNLIQDGEKSVRKGIRKQKKTIEEHKERLRDPSKYDHPENIDTPDKLLNAKLSWLNDVQRNTEEVILKEQYLKKRR